MAESLAWPDLVGDLCGRGVISAADVLALRRGNYADGVCTADEAEEILRLDQSCEAKDPAWNQFFVDSLTDYFVWQSVPRGYVSDRLSGWLIGQIGCDGRIDQFSELELLVNIVHRATACPEALVLFALAAVRESILAPRTAVYGSNRPPGLITAADVAIIRKIIHAPGGDGSITVTRREAELIFDLHDATRGSDNAPEWRDLFVKAIACHLMFPRPAPRVPGAEEELRREAWLKERRSIGRMLASVGLALARRNVPFVQAWRDVDPLGWHRAREEQEVEDRRVREALAHESIDAAEAAWLASRLGKAGVLHENECALLVFIRENAPRIDPALHSVMGKAG